MEVEETEVAVPVTPALPGWSDLGIAPVWKLLPVIVTVTVASCAALFGVILGMRGRYPHT